MADEQDLANALFGNSRLETSDLKSISTMQGVAVSDSVDGKVKVRLDAESIPTTAGVEENVVEVTTTPSVKEGDTVTITSEGGVLKSLTVTGNAGSGDRTQQSADDASKVATNYIDIDENEGITVGNMTDETLGKNTYIDANGVQIRDGETALASFSADRLILGIKPQNIKETKYVQLLGNSCIISATQTGEDTFVSKIASPYLILDANSACTIKMGDGSTAITGTYITLGSNPNTLALDGATQQWKVKGGNIYGATTLYNSTSATWASTITLSSAVTNFAFLDVVCINNDNEYVTQRVYDPAVNKKFNVYTITGFINGSTGTGAWVKTRTFKIASTTTISTATTTSGGVTYTNAGNGHICSDGGSWETTPGIKIVKVIGWK